MYPSAGTAVCYHCGQLTSHPGSRRYRCVGMGDPATLVESATTPIITAIPTVVTSGLEGEILCSVGY